MKIQGLLAGVAASFVLLSCGSGGETKAPEEGKKKIELAKEVCKYSYGNDTQVKWTAFKFTDRVAVGGTLDSVVVNSTKKVENPLNLMEGLSFDIYTSSVNSNNADRDMKLMNTFFGSMVEGETIAGKIVSVKGDDAEGTAMVELTMNGVTAAKEFMYAIKGSSISLTGNIDVVNWNAKSSIDALNKLCEDLHKGADGISSLSSDVDIEVVTNLAKECK